MVKAVLFDFWGTLADSGVFPSPVKQVRRILHIRESFPEYIVKFEEIFMKNQFLSLKQGFQEVAKAFGVRPRDDQIEQLVGLWNKKKLLAEPYPETMEVLGNLKKKYKIALISNTDCFSLEPVLEKYKMGEIFDGIFLSYKEGHLKTEKQLFEKALKKLKIKPEDAVMVGDSIASDMKGAEQAGIKGILVDRRERNLDYKTKVKTLAELEQFL